MIVTYAEERKWAKGSQLNQWSDSKGRKDRIKARTRLASLKNLCSAEQDHILMLTVHTEVLIWLEELNGLLEQRCRLS